MMKIMKTKNYIIAGFITLLSLFSLSCSDYLDINDNPNYPTEAPLANLLPSAGATTIAQWAYNGQLLGELWMQITTQGNSTNQYNTTVNYSLTTSSYPGFWSNAYSNTLPDLKYAIALAEEENAWNYWVICKILTAYNYHMLVDWYENIPFTEAIDAANFPQPKYDDGKTVVIPGILAMLDEAIAKESAALASSNPKITVEDYFFGGDIQNWIAFAKSLKLKIYMRDFNTNRVAIQSLLDAGGLLTEDCAMTAFEDQINKGNPLYEYNIRQLNTRENIRACHTMTELLFANEDPRIANFYEVTTKAAEALAAGEQLDGFRDRYEGLPCGTKPSTAEADEDGIPITKTSRYKQAYDDPAFLMNAAESSFQRAEAWARLGNVDKAKTEYEDGVTKAFARWGYNASSFIAGPYQFDSSSEEAMIKCIMIQKWIASVKANSWDMIMDRNRTGYPEISSAQKVRVSNVTPGLESGYELGTLVNPGSTVLQPRQFPRRMLVPEGSSLYNPNAPETKALYEPQWWQVADGK